MMEHISVDYAGTLEAKITTWSIWKWGTNDYYIGKPRLKNKAQANSQGDL